MITTKFVANGIRFTIVGPMSLREWHERSLDIKPDLSLWSSKQKRTAMRLQLEPGQKREPKDAPKSSPGSVEK